MAATVLYWLAVVIVSAVLVFALVRFLEGRDASSLDGAAGGGTAQSSATGRAAP